MSPAYRNLRKRARMLAAVRAFFADRGVLEVDPGSLVKCPPNDANIEVIRTDQEGVFLHTSPEYAMKRLLAQGVGDCYFLGHVYRKAELGRLHNPEFTMAEWYRLGISLDQMILETCEMLFVFFGPLPIEKVSYRDAFARYAGVDYTRVSLEQLQQMTQSSWPRDTCLHYLLTHRIEPHLGLSGLTVLMDFPPYEAALACRVQKGGEEVAERFEIYYRTVELANGYHELSNAKELKERFDALNQARGLDGKETYPLDEKFLKALERLPDCCGVALGFDRALMLHAQSSSLQEILPFSWDEY